MSFGSDHPLCPVCRARMTQSVPGDSGTWTCFNHGDFMGGTGTSGTSGATVQTAAYSASGATAGDIAHGQGF